MAQTEPLRDPTGALYQTLGEGIQAFADAGLLYLLNEFHLHGQGVEVRVVGDEVRVYGDGRSVRQWDPELVAEGGPIEARRTQVRQLILDCQQYNWEGTGKATRPGSGQGCHSEDDAVVANPFAGRGPLVGMGARQRWR